MDARTPVRTYETVLHGHQVTVKVYPPQASSPDVWVRSSAGQTAYQVDVTYYDRDPNEKRPTWK